MGSLNNLTLLTAFLVGSSVGSFVNVLILRLPRMILSPYLSAFFFLTTQFQSIPRKENLLFPPSSCESCGKRLTPLELIPLLGFFLCRGKCRSCKVPLSLQYPLIELLTGLLYTLLVAQYGLSWQTAAYLFFAPVLLAVFVIDLRTYLIPDRLTYPSLAVGLLLSFKTIGLLSALQGGILGFLLFYGILLFSRLVYKREGMGLGDVKLATCFGIFFGPKVLLIALFLSFLLGGAVAIVLLGFQLRKRSDFIPFGPALVSGALMTIFFSKSLLHWVRNILP